MVKTISTIVLAMIRRFKWLILAMIIVSALGSSMMVGLFGAYESLKKSSYDYLSNYGYPDITLNTSYKDQLDSTALSKVEGVEKTCSRIVFQTGIQSESDSSLASKVTCFTNDDLESFYFYEGNKDSDGLFVEKKFATDNNIKLDSYLTMKLPMLGEKKFQVKAIVTSPDCLYGKQSSASWGQNIRFGLIFMPESVYSTILMGFDPPFNQYLVKTKEGFDNQTVLDSLKSTFGDKVSSSFTKEDSEVMKKINNNLGPLKSLSIYLPLIFFVGAVLVLSLFLSQIIRQYHSELGILTAIGFTKTQLMIAISILVLGLTLIASLLAVGIGTGLMNVAFGLFMKAIRIPVGKVQLDVGATLLAALIGIVIGQVASLISEAMIFKTSPLELMSTSPKVKVEPETIADKGPYKNSKATTKLVVLSFLRSKGRFVVSAICLLASIFLITASCSFHYSKEGILNQLFEVRLVSDAQIGFTSYPTSDTLNEIKNTEGVTSVEECSFLSATVSFNGQSEDININGVPSNHSLMNIPDDNQGIISSVDGFVLESHTAKRLGIQAGDNVLLNDQEIKVAALSNQYVYRISYLPLEESFNYGSYEGIVFCKLSDKEALKEKAFSLDDYYGITFKDELLKASKEEFAVYDVGVYIAILFSMVMGFIIVFNAEQTNLLEQKKTLSIMRVLGVKMSQISLWTFLKILLQLGLAFLVGLPLGTLVSKAILASMNTLIREYPLIINPYPYLITIGVVLLFSLVSHFICMQKVRHWNLAINTKSRT
jgi:putative ABC transport system permease protein